MHYSYEKAIARAKKIILEAPEGSKVYVGADSVRSKKRGEWRARYCAIIIVHLASKNGGQVAFWTEEHPEYGNAKTGGNTKVRLLYEATIAINAFNAIIDECLERDFPIEIHLDLNPSPKHKSNEAVKEACGYVLGSTGVDPKIKPFSFAASRAADEACKGRVVH